MTVLRSSLRTYGWVMFTTAGSVAALMYAGWPVARLGVAFLLVLMLPGYTLLSLLDLRRRGTLDTLTYSFAFGILVAVLVGYALHLSPWGVRRLPLLVVFSLVIAVLATAGLIRRFSVQGQERE